MRPRAFTVAIVACFTAAATRPVMGAGFDAAAGDAFASAADRTLTVIHEDTPDTYHVTQTLETMPGSRNMAVDPATQCRVSRRRDVRARAGGYRCASAAAAEDGAGHLRGDGCGTAIVDPDAMKLPHRVQMSVVEEYEDGSTIQIDYEDAPLPANDPYVLTRLRPIGRTSSSEMITEFAPAPTRPLTYPAGLPFVQKRHVWTTESPDGSVSPGARWPCQDPDAVIAAVIEASRSDGWLIASDPPIASTILPATVFVLSRQGATRAITKVEADGVSIVQLSDVFGD